MSFILVPIQAVRDIQEDSVSKMKQVNQSNKMDSILPSHAVRNAYNQFVISRRASVTTSTASATGSEKLSIMAAVGRSKVGKASQRSSLSSF